MPQATKECRVCGKVYTACNTTRHFDGSFHWREVACSPECGEEYLQRIIESREPKKEEPPKKEKAVRNIKAKKSIFTKDVTEGSEESE